MSNREKIIKEAEAYQRAGDPLPLDLISALMEEGIDHTLYQDLHEPVESDDVHNVD